MRRAIPFFALLLATTACGSADQGGGSGSGPPNRTASNDDLVVETRGDAQRPGSDSSREAGPDIGPATAPDVAFAYRYGFRLPADRIAAVQGRHQQICERLTLARCRITGMTYRAENAEDVEATLAFAVDPAVASAFGREAVEQVNAAEGTVTESHITGEDAGSPLRANQRQRADLEAELARLETRLRGLDPASAEKTGLEARAAQLREQVRALREAGNAGQEALATTPIAMRYGAGRYAPGPAPTPTLAETAEASGETAMAGLLVLLRILIVLAPWAIVGLIGWWGVRVVRRRLARPGEPPIA